MKTTFDIQLSPNFNLSEFVQTDHATHATMDFVTFTNIYDLADVLQKLRDLFEKPIYINSGFRSWSVNKKVGGVPRSYHLYGRAVDFTTKNAKLDNKIYEYIKQNIDYLELIKYPNFIHLAI